MASAGAAQEPAGINPAQLSPGGVPVRPTEGRRARGTSLRAPHPLADRETEAQSTSANWEEAPGSPPAGALHMVPAWPGCCCRGPLPSPAACGRNKQRMSLAAKQTKGASSQGCGKPGQGTGAGRARSPQGCSQGEDTCPHHSQGETPAATGSPAFALRLPQGTHHPGAFSLSPSTILSRPSSHGWTSQSQGHARAEGEPWGHGRTDQ